MRVKKLIKLPKCDFCTKEAHYDAPVIGIGSWAFACDDCKGRLVLGFGTKLELKRHVDKVNIGQIVDAIEYDSVEYLESLILDSELREVGCPLCGESRSMEIDATEFTCDCGALVKMAWLC